MENEDKLLDVARYLEGDMDAEESQAFKILLGQDLALQGQVDEYKHIHDTLKMKLNPSVEEVQVAETLGKLNKQYFSQGNTTKVIKFNNYLKWMSIAAVLVIGLLVWAPWSVGLYEKYAISRQMSVVERGEGKQNNLEQAAALYNAKDFAAALTFLEKEYQVDQENAMVAYYYGITLIENKQEDKARTVLTKLYEGESVFKYDAVYYIALSYIKQKNTSEALKWLAKVPVGSTNYDLAKELTEKLR